MVSHYSFIMSEVKCLFLSLVVLWSEYLCLLHPPNSHVEILTLKGMVLGGGGL